MTSDKRYPTFSLMYGSEYKSFVLLEAYEERLAEAEVLVKALETHKQGDSHLDGCPLCEALKAWRMGK